MVNTMMISLKMVECLKTRCGNQSLGCPGGIVGVGKALRLPSLPRTSSGCNVSCVGAGRSRLGCFLHGTSGGVSISVVIFVVGPLEDMLVLGDTSDTL